MNSSLTRLRSRKSATAAAASLTLALAGCGGGGGGTATPVQFSGKVIDGYIKGAIVCLDLNSNLQCDANEPSATSAEDGSYSFSYSGSIDGVKVLATVPVGAVDSELGTVTQAFELLAPAESAATVTPLTTLVANQMLTQKVSAEEAEKAIKTQLNLQAPSLLGYDFKKEKDAETLKVAQVVAAAIATAKTTMSDLNSTQSLGLDKTEVLKAAISEVKAVVLPSVISAEGKATIDPVGKTQAELVEAVKVKADVGTVIEGRLQQVVAQTKTGAGSVTDLRAVFKEGFVIADKRSGDYLNDKGERVGRWNGFTDELTTEWVTYDSAKHTKVQSTWKVWLKSGTNGAKWYGIFDGGEGMRHVYDGKSWQESVGDPFTTLTPSFKDNCTIIPLTEKSTENGMRVCMVAKDVSGKKMSDFLKDEEGKSLVCRDAQKNLIANCDPNQTFPSGSVGYDLTVSSTLTAYEIYTGSLDWDGYPFEGWNWTKPGAVVPTIDAFINQGVNNPNSPQGYDGNNCSVGFRIASVKVDNGVKKGTIEWGENTARSCSSSSVPKFTETTTFYVETVGGKEVLRTFVPVLYRKLNPGDLIANEKVFAAVEKDLTYMELNGSRVSDDTQGAKSVTKRVTGIFGGEYQPVNRSTTIKFTGNLNGGFQLANKTLFEASMKALGIGDYPYAQ